MNIGRFGSVDCIKKTTLHSSISNAMKKIFSILLLLSCLTTLGQVNGDFRSKQSGDWNSSASWEVFNSSTLSWDPASTIPTSANSVFLQKGDSMYLTADASCKDLHLHLTVWAGDSARLTTGAFVLKVYGKLRSYSANKGDIPGTSLAGISNSKRFLVGKIQIAGGSRTLTSPSEWGDPFNCIDWVFEVNLNNSSDTVWVRTNIRAGNMIISKGAVVLDASANNITLRPDSGVNSTGMLTVKSGGCLVLNEATVARTATERSGTFMLEQGAKLVLPAGTTTNNIAAKNVALNGLVISRNGKLPWGGGITGAVLINTFNDLRLESNVALPRNITINGTLTLTGFEQMFVIPYAITYGPSAYVEYADVALQAISINECPTVGGPQGLIINNPAGVVLLNAHTFAHVRMIKGNLSMGSGSLTYTGVSKLSYEGATARTAGDEFTAVNGPKILSVECPSLSLTDHRTVNTLNLSGKLFTSASAVLTLTDAPGTITGAGPAAYVDGPLAHTVSSTSSTTKIFPLGSGNEYRPLELSLSQDAATATTYTAAYLHPASVTPQLPASILSAYTSRAWSFAKGAGAAMLQARVTLPYAATDGISDSTKLRIIYGSGLVWNNLGGTGNAGLITTDSTFGNTGAFMLARAKSPGSTSSSFPAASDMGLMVYPNPASHQIKLEIQSPLISPTEIQVNDISGRLIKKIWMEEKQPFTLLDVSDMPGGVYFISLRSAEFTVSGKIIVQK